MINKKFATFLALMILLIFASVASADVLPPVTDTIPVSTLSWTDSFTIDQFNPADNSSCPTLSKVELTYSGQVAGSMAYENLDLSPADITLTLKAGLELYWPGANTVVDPPLSTIEPANSRTITNVPAFDGVDDKDGDSGDTIDDITGVAAETITFTDGPTLALFTGPGTLTFPVIATGESSGSGSSNLSLIINTNAGATISVVYTCGLADWGDLPDAPGGSPPAGSYPTLLEHEGPHHFDDGNTLLLGQTIDYESDGLPESTATGDDANDTGSANDEDGAEPTPGVAWGAEPFPGAGFYSYSVDVYPNGEGCLMGWIDWNDDGDFDDPSELIIDNEKVSGDGATAITYDGYQNVVSFPHIDNFFTLFRFYPLDDGDVCTSPKVASGPATGGEVESHHMAPGPTAITLQSIDVSSVYNVWYLLILLVTVLAFFCTVAVVVRRKRMIQ